MAGETAKTRAIVLDIRPWSKTSHIVTWLSEDIGAFTSVIKGATRPKSAFLGQYDFFYTCEVVYYIRHKTQIYTIKECSPLNFRDGLRGKWRKCAIASYAARLANNLSTSPNDAAVWFKFINAYYTFLEEAPETVSANLCALLRLETYIAKLAGISPDLTYPDENSQWSSFSLDRGKYGDGIRTFRLARETALAVKYPEKINNIKILLDALRFFGIFLRYHLDCPIDVRRTILKMLTS